MSIVNKNVSTPYYGIYGYRIKFVKLTGFIHRLLQHSLYGIPNDVDHWYYWRQEYIDRIYPKSQDEVNERENLCTFLVQNSDPDTKIVYNHSATFLYIKDEAVYHKWSKIGGDLQLERNEPLDLDGFSLVNNLKPNEELRKSLFFKKYRYKVIIDVNRNGITLEEIYSLAETIGAIDSVRLNKPMADLLNMRNLLWWKCNVHAVYCSDSADATYCVLLFGDLVKKVTNAVLFDELRESDMCTI